MIARVMDERLPPEPMQPRIRELRDKKHLSLEELASLAGTTKQQIFKLEKGIVKLTMEWMYRLAPHLGVEPHELVPSASKPPPLPQMPQNNQIPSSLPKGMGATNLSHIKRDLPVLGVAAGGKEGVIMIPVEQDPVDYTFRPPQLEGVQGAFAIFAHGDSMDPKYCNGDTLWVHPHLPIRPGDGVLIVKHNDEALVKRLVRRKENAVTVRQLNPPMDFDIPQAEIRALYKVIGSLSA